MDTRPVVDIDLNVNIFIYLFSDHTNMQQEEVDFNLIDLNVDASSFVLDLNMEPCVEEDDIEHIEEGLHHNTNLNTGTFHSSYNVAFIISPYCYQTYLLWIIVLKFSGLLVLLCFLY